MLASPASLAGEPPVFVYHTTVATLLVFDEHAGATVYGLDEQDRVVVRFAEYDCERASWHDRWYRLDYRGWYNIEGRELWYTARNLYSADVVVVWPRENARLLPCDLWAWPRLGIEQPSPDEVLAAFEASAEPGP